MAEKKKYIEMFGSFTKHFIYSIWTGQFSVPLNFECMLLMLFVLIQPHGCCTPIKQLLLLLSEVRGQNRFSNNAVHNCCRESLH